MGADVFASILLLSLHDDGEYFVANFSWDGEKREVPVCRRDDVVGEDVGLEGLVCVARHVGYGMLSR